MSKLKLITPTLLNSFFYYRDFEANGDWEKPLELQESESREDFIRMLSREKFTPTEAMERGNILEADIVDYCEGRITIPAPAKPLQEIGDILKGGMWQTRVSMELDGKYLIYGKADCIKRDAGYDVKSAGSYEVGKYLKSAQHRIYMACTGLPKFSYMIVDAYRNNWWREDYYESRSTVDEIRCMIHEFEQHLANDAEARQLYNDKWDSYA